MGLFKIFEKNREFRGRALASKKVTVDVMKRPNQRCCDLKRLCSLLALFCHSQMPYWYNLVISNFQGRENTLENFVNVIIT